LEGRRKVGGGVSFTNSNHKGGEESTDALNKKIFHQKKRPQRSISFLKSTRRQVARSTSSKSMERTALQKGPSKYFKAAARFAANTPPL